MNRIIITLLLQSVVICGFAQVNVSPNILGAPFQGQHFNAKASDNDVQGNSLLFDDWKAGEIILKDGELFRLQKINFDAATSQFMYSMDGVLYDFTDNVETIKIFGENHQEDSTSDMIFKDNLLPEQPGFVQVLADGKITVVRKFSKKPEGENYSNGIVNNSRSYVLHTEDIAIKENKIIPIKFNSSSLEELASDKIGQVNSYVKSNNLKVKKQNDFLKSINYYNSLNSSAN